MSAASDPPGAAPWRGLLPWGTGGALAACLLNGVWLACMIILASAGDVALQARAHPAIFRLSVGAALLLTLAQVPILIAMTALAAQRDVARALVGGLLYALYIPLNVVGYFSYGRLAPLVHADAMARDATARLVAEVIEIGHPLALTGALPLAGYGVLGLAWCLLATALWHRGRLWKVAAGLLCASGIASVLGAIGTFIDLGWLTSCCFIGGVISLPALAVVGAAMWREPRTPAPGLAG